MRIFFLFFWQERLNSYDDTNITDEHGTFYFSYLFNPDENHIVLGQGVRFASEFPCDGNALSLLRSTESNACFEQYDGLLRITTAPEHRGQAAEVVFLAVDDSYTYSYDGKSWQGNALGTETILNAQNISELPFTLDVTLPNLDLFNEVFAGYRLSDGDVIYTQVK